MNTKEYNRRRVVLLHLVVLFSVSILSAPASGQAVPSSRVNDFGVQARPESSSFVFSNPRTATVAYTLDPDESNAANEAGDTKGADEKTLEERLEELEKSYKKDKDAAAKKKDEEAAKKAADAKKDK